MIGGIPNVGKSTVLNALRSRDEVIAEKSTKKSGAKVGALPGVTKQISGFKIIVDPLTYVVDTPGIIIPKIREHSEDGLKLCACNCIRDGILDMEYICDYILFKLNKEALYGYYVTKYELQGRKPTDSIHDLTSGIMKRYNIQERAVACT